MRRGRRPHPDLLTPREQEVLALLREGLTNEQIAQRLGISESGARYHVSEILSKLGVSSRQEAAAVGMRRQGLAALLPAGLNLGSPMKAIEVSGRVVLAGAAAALLALALGLALMLQRSSSSPESFSTAATAAPEGGTATPAPLGTTCDADFPPPSQGTKTLGRGDVGMRWDPFCIAWTDIYSDEAGFRVVVRYNGGEEFTYNVGANVNEVFPPPSNWPDNLSSLPDINSPDAGGALAGLKRKDVQVTVYAQTPGGEVVVDGFAVQRQ